MKFTITSQKAHELGANMTGMDMGKNRQFFCWIKQKKQGFQNTIKKNLLMMIKKLQTIHIFQNTSENFMKLFSKQGNKKLR